MGDPDVTNWTLIRDAAQGHADAREAFAQAYEPVVRAYLGARWRGSSLATDVDDAIQEVFVECFRQRGVLARADPDRRGGFRAFLYGVVRNVARRWEERRGRGRERQPPSDYDPEDVETAEETLGRTFDRAWAAAIVRQAGRRQVEKAREKGPEALRRVDLLRLRIVEEMPIRDIARRWEADPAWLHHEYAKARREFKTALTEVVAADRAGTPEEVEAECQRLLEHLG